MLRSADLLVLQSEVLESVARGEPLFATLDLLCRHIEALAPDVRCSVLLLDGDCVRHGAAPSLPEVYNRAVDGQRIGPIAGSCGTAAFTGEAVLAEDIETDPRWEPYRAFALPLGLRACWSTPVKGVDGRVLGTFALYYAAPSRPLDFHRDAVQAATHLASIAIERHLMMLQEQERLHELQRSHAAMAELNTQLERRVIERTAVLDERNAVLTRTIDELQRTQSALIETRKLLSLGRMVAGVAHELNTPIGNARLLASSLLTRSQQIGEHLGEGNLRRSELAAFVSAATEAGQMLDASLQEAVDLLASFRAIVVEPKNIRREPVVLDELVATTLLLMATPIRLSGAVVTSSVPQGMVLESYPAQLNQVLSTVLGNALEHGVAGRVGSRVTISAAPVDRDSVLLEVRDNGCGIAADDLAHVFDPLFTTRLGGDGPSLGLHVAYALVNGLLGGQIALQSTLEVGTQVSIRLPLRAPEHGLPAR
ncbi:MAG: ATP-binding protein [Rhodocyclaceae bacterium]